MLAGAAHHRHSSPQHGTQPWWLRLIERLGEIMQRPSQLHFGHLVPLLVHDLELAGLAAASLIGIVVAVMVAGRVTAGTSPTAATVRRRFRLSLPETFERAGLEGFFRSVSPLLRLALFGRRPSLGFDLRAVGERLEIELLCAAEVAQPVVAALEAAIEGIGIEELPVSGLQAQRRWWARCTLRPAGSRWLPLQAKHPVDPARFVLAMLQGESEREQACAQFVFSPLGVRARRRGRREARRLRTGQRGGLLAGLGSFGLELVNDGLDLFTPGSTPARTQSGAQTYQPDGWALKRAGAIEEKTGEPLLAATIRLAVAGGTRRSSRWRLQALAASFGQFHALGGLRPGRELFGARRFERALPALRPPLALTAAEAAAVLPLPTLLSETRLVLAEAPARRLPPAADAPRLGIRLGRVER